MVKIINTKSPVKLRYKKLSNGNSSLYLDIYNEGNRTKEYLKLYLLPEKNAKVKETNRKTLELAETIRAERVLNLQSSKSGFFNPKSNDAKMVFIDYMAKEVKKMENLRSGDYIRRYNAGIGWVKRYNPKTLLKDIDRDWVQGFIKFMATAPNKWGRILNPNTAHEYLIYVANILNIAVREGIIPSNPTKNIAPADRPKKYESVREFLTKTELKKLMDTFSPERYSNIRGAFLFSCFCGLRYSDIEQLKWKHIRKTEDGIVIDKKLQKTQKMHYLPLNLNALSFLPPKTKEDDLVFNLPRSMTTVEAYIKVWCEFAGINKHVTFHTARHTFSMNILAYGGDIYALSKLLGHKRVTTTQIYADILGETKKKTVELLDKIGDEKPLPNEGEENLNTNSL